MLALVPGSLPRADDVRVDLRVIGAALLLALAAGTVFGIATAMFGTRRRLAESLHGASARTTGDIGRRFGRRLLVSAEVALSLVLLVGATLLGVSFARLQRVAPGFVPEHAVSAQVTLPVGDVFDPARDGPRWAATFAALVQRLGAVPGVRAVGAVSSLPLSGAEESGTFEIEGRPLSPGEHGPSTEYAVIEGDYFDAMGIRLLEGRAFDGRDRAGGEPVVVVSRALARSAFPGESAIGKRIRGGFDFVSQWRTIVGVVDDVRQTSLDAAPSVTAYVPESQMSYPGLTIVARTRGAPATVIPGMRRALRVLDPTLAFAELRPLEDVLTDSLARQRFSMAVLAAFAAAALALAVVGLYGVIALSVGQRTREIGIRMALGARAADVLRLVLGEGLRLTVGGIAGGVLVSLALTRVLRSLLFDTSPLDPGAYLAAIAGVTVVALLATYLPARRATRVDPTVALGE
jgi:predicted permease